MAADHAEADLAEATEEDLAVDRADASADRIIARITTIMDREDFGDPDPFLAAGITVRITAEADALADFSACFFFPLF